MTVCLWALSLFSVEKKLLYKPTSFSSEIHGDVVRGEFKAEAGGEKA